VTLWVAVSNDKSAMPTCNRLNAICPYFTMFPLEFPLSILRSYASPGEWVLDPFCGRGTTVFAARLCGLPAVGIDSYPVAAAIAQAKLLDVSPQAIVDELLAILKSAPPPDSVPEGNFWELAFHPDVLFELCRLREELLRKCTTPERQALRAVILGALHGPRAKCRPTYLSNQAPRTYAPKPAYAVRFWRARDLQPERVDLVDIVATRAQRYFASALPPARGWIIEGDSRDPATFAQLSGIRFKWIVTSPPYYGMRTYRPDQWLRLWFLGGPAWPDYSQNGQISHSSAETFARDLRRVWSLVASVADTNARMIIRFGRIHDRRVDPLHLLERSLANTGWEIEAIRSAGSAARGKRQAMHFTTTRDPLEEHDVWVRLRL